MLFTRTWRWTRSEMSCCIYLFILYLHKTEFACSFLVQHDNLPLLVFCLLCPNNLKHLQIGQLAKVLSNFKDFHMSGRDKMSINSLMSRQLIWYDVLTIDLVSNEFVNVMTIDILMCGQLICKKDPLRLFQRESFEWESILEPISGCQAQRIANRDNGHRDS